MPRSKNSWMVHIDEVEPEPSSGTGTDGFEHQDQACEWAPYKLSQQPPCPAACSSGAAFVQRKPKPTPEHCLAEVDQSITFKPIEYNEHSSHLRIHNIAPGPDSIIFKIKTTSPDHYRVRPTIAVIEPGGTAFIPIISQPGTTPAQIEQDRFQVQICLLPQNMVNPESVEGGSVTSSNPSSLHNSNFADLNNLFKRLINSSGTAIDTFKVTAKVEPMPINPAGTTVPPRVVPPASIPNAEGGSFKKSPEDKRIGDTLLAHNTTSPAKPEMEHLQTLLYFILGAVVVLIALVIMQWFKGGQCGRVETKCPVVPVGKGECGGCKGDTGWYGWFMGEVEEKLNKAQDKIKMNDADL